MQPRTIQNTGSAQKLGYCRKGQKLHLRVITANVTLRLAKEAALLEMSFSGQNQAGYPVVSTDGPLEIDWGEGEVWGMGVAGNATPIQLVFNID